LSQTKNLCAIAKLNILVTDYALLYQLSNTPELEKNIQYTFLVTTEQEYDIAATDTEQYAAEGNSILPLYTGSNMQFFQDYLFIDEEELLDVTLTKREIFIRQSINITDFGKLVITPNGTVYANLNEEPLGNIDDTPLSLVYKEFTQGHSWLRVRDCKPCCDCVYQWLCPSPSNYERVIGKCNFCNIRQP
jgi:pseudo-rSAM protein